MENINFLYKDIALYYFKLFSNKDIAGLRQMFHKSVTLRDWDIYSEGINSVIETIDNIFKNVESLVIYPKILSEETKTIFAEIDIKINNKEILKVVDILEFNDEGKIIAIRAFKG